MIYISQSLDIQLSVSNRLHAARLGSPHNALHFYSIGSIEKDVGNAEKCTQTRITILKQLFRPPYSGDSPHHSYIQCTIRHNAAVVDIEYICVVNYYTSR